MGDAGPPIRQATGVALRASAGAADKSKSKNNKSKSNPTLSTNNAKHADTDATSLININIASVLLLHSGWQQRQHSDPTPTSSTQTQSPSQQKQKQKQTQTQTPTQSSSLAFCDIASAAGDAAKELAIAAATDAGAGADADAGAADTNNRKRRRSSTGSNAATFDFRLGVALTTKTPSATLLARNARERFLAAVRAWLRETAAAKMALPRCGTETWSKEDTLAEFVCWITTHTHGPHAGARADIFSGAGLSSYKLSLALAQEPGIDTRVQVTNADAKAPSATTLNRFEWPVIHRASSASAASASTSTPGVSWLSALALPSAPEPVSMKTMKTATPTMMIPAALARALADAKKDACDLSSYTKVAVEDAADAAADADVDAARGILALVDAVDAADVHHQIDVVRARLAAAAPDVLRKACAALLLQDDIAAVTTLTDADRTFLESFAGVADTVHEQMRRAAASEQRARQAAYDAAKQRLEAEKQSNAEQQAAARAEREAKHAELRAGAERAFAALHERYVNAQRTFTVAMANTTISDTFLATLDQDVATAKRELGHARAALVSLSLKTANVDADAGAGAGAALSTAEQRVHWARIALEQAAAFASAYAKESAGVQAT